MKFQILIPVTFLLSALNAASPADYYGGYNPCRPRTVTSTSKVTKTLTATVTKKPSYCPTPCRPKTVTSTKVITSTGTKNHYHWH
ncbi:hypothetical protein K502DRAFT_351140 [Neoconidiobolus thromboides FSU 785]|nr:hypothetical protein K502DRAFT_351930 [Neoconidiobolus thromboides FSU 785]KAI9293313.1 hypothetical protein K502DRAFT_351140 [Neoconidiobolus thromboides FSU 785]